MWLVSGMGSGILPSLSFTSVSKLTGLEGISSSASLSATNHLSVGLFNGTTFLDLSSDLPEEMDGILYANAFNGTTWLIGGGYQNVGVLFSFNGTGFTDLTSGISAAVPSFESIQSIAWNGHYWLIGGIGFLVMYNGSKFTDLTPYLNKAITLTPGENSVNSIAWNGSTWLLGGGVIVAIPYQGMSSAWLASFSNPSTITDETSKFLSSYVQKDSAAILSIASAKNTWVVGGYSGNQSLLLQIDQNTSAITNLSNLVDDMQYVIWVGIS
jgi:hypothetical protein